MKQFQEDALRITSETGLDIPAYSIINELLEWRTFDELDFDYEYVESIRLSIEKVYIVRSISF
jgi:hypothetical protein